MSATEATPAQRAIRIRRGITYRRGYTYTQFNDAGVQVPLVATNYTATLVIRKRLGAAGPLLTLTSSPAAGITLTTVSGSVVVTVKVTPAQSAALAVGTDYVYTLALFLIADATENYELVTAEASVSLTGLAP